MLQNNLAVLLELSGDIAGAETMLRAALAEDPALPQISKNLADILYRNGRYDEAARGLRAGRQAQPRAGRRPLLQAGQHRLQAAGPRPGPGELGPGDRRSIPGHQLARANLEMLDLAQ